MERKEYEARADAILERLGRTAIDLFHLVADYYKENPKEKGKEDTQFYEEMSGLIDDFEAYVSSMRYKLKDPDSIQTYDTR